MRSLRIIESICWGSLTERINTQNISVDFDTGNVYIATDGDIIAFDPTTGKNVYQVSLVDAGYVPKDGVDTVVGIQHLPDQMSACVATASGDVILWNVNTNELECVGTVDSGLTAMSWSPDQELVVFATGQKTLIMMTREFDPITEVPIFSGETGEAEFVSVGWGKKETQFHGSEGKQAAVRKIEEMKPASEWDDQKVRISWRGDGQYLVVSSLSPLSGARELRVLTREMVLHSTSEKLAGIEHCLNWKPSGSLIASSQRKSNKHQIVFFEMNGLMHGSFNLPFSVKEVTVREVLWNQDSCVLAVWCQQVPNDQADFHPKSYVQLWTVNNYHWYQKQSLEFQGTASDRVTAVTWDTEHAYRIHILCANGRYLQYTLSWTTFNGQNNCADDLTNVAVIDGDQVLVTPLRTMVVPPPMCAYYLQLPCPVSQMTFDPTPGSNAMGALLNDGRMAIYRFDQGRGDQDSTVKLGAAGGGSFKTTCKTPFLCGIYDLKQTNMADYPLNIHHLTWIGNNKFLFCYQDKDQGGTVIVLVELTQDKCQLIDSYPVSESVLATAVNSETGHVVVQLADRTLLTYDVTASTFLPFCDVSGDEVTLPLSCTQMALCTLGGQEVVLGLTDRFRFYVNDIEVANNCTSFALHDDFLLLTTHSHTCRCINRNTELKELPTLSDGKAHPFDESVRRVERGSRAVHVVPADTRLVLQMPRGNLEVVHPRALVLCAVRKQLNGLQFREAFNLMRKHRINMNLIYDHDPRAFLDNVDTFISQIDSVNHINLFLADLQQEDVTVTMYTAAYNRDLCATTTTPGKTPSKVDTVCHAVRQALLSRDDDRYLLSILTTYVKVTTPQLDVALNTIKELKAEGGAARRAQAEEAMKYLLLLVDVNELYDHALGSYDFDLVLMVAERSQKDPKEYIPFLNGLRQLEENYRHFSIDLHLKRYKKALTHIAKCGEDHFDECLKLVKDQSLYSEALQLYPIDSQFYKDLSSAYGEYLAGRARHDEAGLVYARAKLWDAALGAHQEAGSWRLALAAAAQLGYGEDRMRTLAADMAQRLAGERRPVEAACLLEQYAEDVEEAIVTLVRGGAWDEALRLMYKHGRTDFIESDLRPALEETHASQTATLISTQADFERHQTRLMVVRREKEKARLELFEAGGDYKADADLFSDTSSATGRSMTSSQYTSSSRRTTSSGRTGKSQRKAQRKKWSLKEGSRHEDLALIEALSQLCRQAEGLKEDVQALLRMLVLFHMEDKASELQQKLSDCLALIERGIPLIWDPDTETSAAPVIGPDSTTNQIVAAMQEQGQDRQKSEVQLDPSLRVPPPMSKDTKWKLHSLGSSFR